MHAKTFVLDRQTVFVGSFNFDPRSRGSIPRTASSSAARNSRTRRPGCLNKGTSPARTYRVTLLGDNDLVWVTEEKGKEVRYYQEPLSRFWRRFSLRCLLWLTPESML